MVYGLVCVVLSDAVERFLPSCLILGEEFGPGALDFLDIVAEAGLLLDGVVVVLGC